MGFPDKYRLTPEQSVFLAKKKWDENVYCGMKMENRAVTFPQTKTVSMIETVLNEINRLGRERVLIAIDGRCASGKTTLAEQLRQALHCPVIHMDDFFLRPQQRTAQRYAEPGGNVDRERFLAEVLEPLQRGDVFSYRPFDCHTMSLGEPVTVRPACVTVIEGTYSCHPALWDCYDLHIFLTTPPEKQLRRLAQRNGGDIQQFCRKWIPLEERYFAACKPQEKCEIVLKT